MVKSLAMKVPGLRQLVPQFFKTLPVNPAGNGDLALFRAGEGEDGEEEWRPTSVTSLPL